MSASTPQIHGPQPHPAGSVIVITGAGSGIGQATAVLAARQGYRVAAWDVNLDGVARTAQAAGEFGNAISAIACDVADAAAIQVAMDRSAALGPLVGLVTRPASWNAV